MRHNRAGRRLGRDMSHRKATMKHLAVALFRHDAISTGVFKAKELRKFAEPLMLRTVPRSTASGRQPASRPATTASAKAPVRAILAIPGCIPP